MTPPLRQCGSLTIVGLGYRPAQHVTPEAAVHLRRADRLFFLANDDHSRRWLEAIHPKSACLNDCCQVGQPGLQASLAMVEQLLAPARAGQRVCAAFPGHPLLYAHTALLALEQARAEGLKTSVVPGVSVEDCLFADLGIDPATHGWQMYEATDFLVFRRRFDPRSSMALLNVGAIGLKNYQKVHPSAQKGLGVLTEVLLETYPAEHEVVLYEISPYPICEPRMDRLPLAHLTEATLRFNTTVFLPALPGEVWNQDALKELMRQVRR